MNTNLLGIYFRGVQSTPLLEEYRKPESSIGIIGFLLITLMALILQMGAVSLANYVGR
jgi:hypothetical protein